MTVFAIAIAILEGANESDTDDIGENQMVIGKIFQWFAWSVVLTCCNQDAIDGLGKLGCIAEEQRGAINEDYIKFCF